MFHVGLWKLLEFVGFDDTQWTLYHWTHNLLDSEGSRVSTLHPRLDVPIPLVSFHFFVRHTSVVRRFQTILLPPNKTLNFRACHGAVVSLVGWRMGDSIGKWFVCFTPLSLLPHRQHDQLHVAKTRLEPASKRRRNCKTYCSVECKRPFFFLRISGWNIWFWGVCRSSELGHVGHCPSKKAAALASFLEARLLT